MACRKRLDKRRDIGPPLERQRRHLQTRGPAFGACLQHGDLLVGKVETHDLAHELTRLMRVEQKVVGANLGQLVAGAPTMEWERRVGAGRHHEAHGGGHMIDEKDKQGMDGGRLDHVVIVEDE